VSTLPGTPSGHEAGELLRLAGVSKTYRRGSAKLCVLRDADLDVRPGEWVCVLTSHGQGGTTLLRIAAGIESADAGLVSFDGQDLATCSDDELSRLLGARIAWVGKHGPRTGVQMFDYIAMPLLGGGGEPEQSGNWIGRWLARRAYRRTVPARVQGALERVGAAGCAKAQWEEMSDWERALVELAHAIAGEPELLLLDDVTDNLGKFETADFIKLVRVISEELQLAVLMSVSDDRAAMLCDRIMTLAGGRLEEGPRPPATAEPPSGPGNVLDFPGMGSGVGSGHLEAGHASSS
jgi:ABC-type cobalamin/Fe3+-siderophores transport system ATPase subunit